MPKIFLTDDVVFDAICPADKDQELYWDYAVAAKGQIRNGSIAGLGLRVTAPGHKSFVQLNGKRCRKVLGSTVVLSVASARLAVIQREQELSLGKDPDIDRVDPSIEVLPEVDHLEGFAKRDMALTKARLVTANDQMLELCNFRGILFLTMARPSDLAKAEFEHFELETLVWHKHNTKGIKLSRSLYEYAYRSVPIHSRVAAMVRAQRQRWPDSKLLFPSHTDQSQPRDNFRKSLDRFKALPGVPKHFQLYDLKRIAISLMLTGQGVSHEAISHYVDHKGNLETTMIYDLGLVDPLRPVTERLGALLGI
ncbi:protein of unknown function [Mesorhizobium sp. NFR06]|uniref:integrase family protein n=1 Tax=Mesorhizobium sp. NFR06 TaxID=1566290 RepID=UPI0008F1EBC3|nr:integrase family protein [Mesorhizobium sp. NFR06]SFP58512.1 protein of unknown function [Mesorhizobium sp. NFR06]